MKVDMMKLQLEQGKVMRENQQKQLLSEKASLQKKIAEIEEKAWVKFVKNVFSESNIEFLFHRGFSGIKTDQKLLLIIFNKDIHVLES